LLGDPYVFLVAVLFLVPAALVAIPVHEVSHAAAAVLQGDPSVRNRGYLRPDPRLFVEPYGLVAVFLVNVGWGRPAPVNEYRLKGVGGQLAYALAGPLANLALAAIVGVAMRLFDPLGVGSLLRPESLPAVLHDIVFAIFFLNLSFFAFNLLPLPGLDGWRVLEALFRRRNPRFFFDAHMRRMQIWQIAAIVVILSSFLGRNLLGAVLMPLYAPAASLILGTCVGYPGLHPCPL
jgi:Zn-dependent protease